MMPVKTYFRFCFTLFCTFISVITICTAKYEDSELYKLFEEFTYHYNKSYVANSTEYECRFKIFKKNIEQADILNKDYFNISKAVYGVTKFSDLSPYEFKAKYLSGYVPKYTVNISDVHPSSLPLMTQKLGIPDKVDWRSKGVLTPIKNQEHCGACWAFSVVETMESMLAIQYNKTVQRLSVQEMIDCDSSNNGCEGGDICKATTWANTNGIVQESYYPLADQTDKCKAISNKLPRVTVKNSACRQFIGKEEGLLTALVQGPVAVAVDATTWHSYVEGIIRFHCSDNINHAVSVVGYDLTGEVPYYIVRNSWGSDFGDHGFLYIKVGDNLCGIASEVSSMSVTNLQRF